MEATKEKEDNETEVMLEPEECNTEFATEPCTMEELPINENCQISIGRRNLQMKEDIH